MESGMIATYPTRTVENRQVLWVLIVVARGESSGAPGTQNFVRHHAFQLRNGAGEDVVSLVRIIESYLETVEWLD